MTGFGAAQLLAEGELNWSKYERQTDRYGAVHIQTGGFFARTLNELDADLPEEYATFDGAPLGAMGRLLVEVTAARESYHIGDKSREISPSTPEDGERIVLGEGELFVETDDNYAGVPTIGVYPEDGRETDWLDIGALYRAHCQTVKVYFESRET
jgi:hypothetical protein